MKCWTPGTVTEPETSVEASAGAVVEPRARATAAAAAAVNRFRKTISFFVEGMRAAVSRDFS
jgi:hypothetical protein